MKNDCKNCPDAGQEICCQSVRKSPIFAYLYARMLACMAMAKQVVTALPVQPQSWHPVYVSYFAANYNAHYGMQESTSIYSVLIPRQDDDNV